MKVNLIILMAYMTFNFGEGENMGLGRSKQQHRDSEPGFPCIDSGINMSSSTELATFAAGCYWGVQKFFKKEFGSALLRSRVGFMGGESKTTSYNEVCGGRTGHAEVLHLQFDPSKTTYEALVTYFFRVHDPTTLNRQANDIGTQYRSAIFYHSEEQKRIAEKLKMDLQFHFKNPIVSEIVPGSDFIDAEDYHQDYLDKNPGGYCSHKLQW